ncbi:hypothetical protein K2X05_12640 [bacterium]|nr:hypothetical protein [bacterium]
MKFVFGFLLVVFASGLIGYEYFNISYWQQSPSTRASEKWKNEIEKISSKNTKLKTAFLLLAKIEQKTTDQQFKEMIDATRSPFKTVSKGTYVLKLQFMPWIEEMKYGYLIQHELFDLQGNKISEFNVNIDIGKLW